MTLRALLLILLSCNGAAVSLRSNARHLAEEDGAPLEMPFAEESLVASQFSKDQFRGEDKMELILSGQFMLMDTHIIPNDSDVVYGIFCKFHYREPPKDPSTAPRYIDLYSKSTHCQEHRARFPLHQVAEAARERDNTKSSGQHSVAPDAFIFHQQKSGSSLLTNMIAASSEQPGQIRVVAEANALGNILKCETCDHDLKVQALQDAMYLLGRRENTDSDEEVDRLFVKLSVASTVGLSVVREAYPDTKWMFVHRDADTVLQKLMDSRVERRVCGLKKRRNPGQVVANFVVSKGKELTTLEDERVCSASLAAHRKIVDEELSRFPDSGRLVEYEHDLMTSEGIEEVLSYLDISLDEKSWDRIEEQRMKRSNDGRGHEWKGEATQRIREEVRAANAEFATSTTY